jgi:uncharacterized membrane protein
MRTLVTLTLSFVIFTGLSSAAAQETTAIVGYRVLAPYAGDWYTTVTSINNLGEIAGWAFNGDDQSVAFVRSADGDDTLIAERGFTTDINDNGDVVGWRTPCTDGSCGFEGFIWTRAGGARSLGTFLPNAINAAGDMAGVCEGDAWQACVMRDGIVSVVGDLGSQALGINASGDVVGTYGDNRAFHLTPDWSLLDVGRAVANDITDKGVIAGHRWLELEGLGTRAVATAWSKRGAVSPRTEPSLGLRINEKNWVLVLAQNADGAFYAYVWKPSGNRRVQLDGGADGFVFPEDMNDHGDVVGSAGTQPVIWQVRNRDF